jgi:hypothetical protein
MKKITICTLLAVFATVARAAGPVVFDLEASLRTSPKTATLNAIVESISYIPLETHKSALLGGGNTLAVVDGNFYLDLGSTPYSPIFRFDGKGKFVRQMTRTGRGPGEYISAFPWYANARLRRLNVVDFMGGGMVVVSTEGGQPTGVKRNKTDGSGWIPLNDGTFVAFREIEAVRPKPAKLALNFFDADGQLTGSVERWARHTSEAPSADLSSIYELRESPDAWSNYRGEALLHEAFNDTLFTIRGHREAIAPHSVIKRGRFAPVPDDTGDKRRRAFLGTVSESAGYLYLSFRYDDKTWYDIWSKRDGRLVVRSSREAEERGSNGFPFTLPDGKVIRLDVAYADGERFYCLLQAVDACRFLSNVKEDDNPVVVSLKLK